MAERLSQKIAAFSIIAIVLWTYPACAKEQFVSYKEASVVLASSGSSAADGSVQIEAFREELQKGAKFLILDARTKKEYDVERLPGAKMPRDDAYYKAMQLFQQQVVREAPSSKTALEKGTKDLPRDTPIITYCLKRCGLSKTLMMDLQQLGFTNVRWLEGGIDVWREKGYPLEK